MNFERIRAEEEVRARQKVEEEDRQRLAGIAAAIGPDRVQTILPAPANRSAEKVAAPPGHIMDPPVDTGATMKLGEICNILGFTMTADFLASLGFQAKQEKNAKVYRTSQFPAICTSLANHVISIRDVKCAA